MTGLSSLSWPCQMARTRMTESCVFRCNRRVLTPVQNHGRLLLLHSASQRNFDPSGDIPVWHIVHATNGCRQPDQSTGRCHEEYGAERGGGHCRQSAVLWATEGEVVDGHKSVVCAKVRMVRGNVRQLKLMTARRDFTDTEILEVGQCFQRCGKHST